MRTGWTGSRLCKESIIFKTRQVVLPGFYLVTKYPTLSCSMWMIGNVVTAFKKAANRWLFAIFNIINCEVFLFYKMILKVQNSTKINKSVLSLICVKWFPMEQSTTFLGTGLSWKMWQSSGSISYFIFILENMKSCSFNGSGPID